jgi:hypothetical protein
MRHEIAVIYDGVRHEIAHIWDIIWDNTVHRIMRGSHDVRSWFANMRHSIANIYDSVRHDIATAWDTIWRNTVTRVVNGIRDVIKWFQGLPGRVMSAVSSLGKSLWNFGSSVLTQFLNGVKKIWNDVSSWFSGLPGKILHALGIHSPPDWAISAGKHVMGGLLKGIAHGASDVKGFFVGLASDITGPLKGVWTKLFGGGGKFGGSVATWTGDVMKALAMEGLPLSLTHNVLYQMQTESGGNPNAINLTDINAQMGDPSRGLMQTIMATFLAYHWPGTSMNIYDPLANIAAAINYARHVYGPTLMANGMGIGSGHGYDTGGWLPTGASIAVNRTGAPERVIGPGGIHVTLQVGGGSGVFDAFLLKWIRNNVRVLGGGDVQVAFGADPHGSLS